MVNPDFEPRDTEEAVLDVLKDEGRANPYLIRDRTGFDKGTVNTALTRLTSAGWLRKVTRGLYEYVDDPRGTPGRAESLDEGDAPAATDDARTAPVSADRAPGEFGGLLDGWEPDTEADARVARTETRRAVEWLRDVGGRRVKSEFVDELAADSPLEDRSWWERAVRPGLQRFADHGLVEYRPGYHDYKWTESQEEA